MALFSREPATHLPLAEGARLDGAPFSIPDSLTAAATLVVVTFQDDAAALSGQWARLGERLAESLPGLGVVELSVFPPRLRLLGDLPLLGARSRAEAAGDAARTAVVYTKRKPFRAELGIRGDGGVTAFLVWPDGQIAWRGDGEIDLHEVEGLEAVARTLLAPPANARPVGTPPAGAQ